MLVRACCWTIYASNLEKVTPQSRTGEAGILVSAAISDQNVVEEGNRDYRLVTGDAVIGGFASLSLVTTQSSISGVTDSDFSMSANFNGQRSFLHEQEDHREDLDLLAAAPDASEATKEGGLEDELHELILAGLRYEIQSRRPCECLSSTVVTRNPEELYAHRLDAFVEFSPECHKYYLLSGDLSDTQLSSRREFPISVSGVWGAYFEAFDADAIIARYYDRWAENPSSKYYPMIAELRGRGFADSKIKLRIKIQWSDAGELASLAGTRMHMEIEMALTGRFYDASLREMQTFKEQVIREFESRQWTLYRAEWTIYDKTVMVAGQIDAMFQDTQGGLHMVDWKRIRDDLCSTAGSQFHRYGSGLCDNLLDNKYNHYALQQNLYAALLSRQYGIEVASMSLVQLHPDRANYTWHDLPQWRQLANEMLNETGKRHDAL